jgi:hypothetical protein
VWAFFAILLLFHRFARNFLSPFRLPRLYVTFPLALATPIGLNPGDQVHWELLDRGELHLVRL